MPTGVLQIKAISGYDVAALFMLVGFIIHIDEGTAAQPGTFQSMTRGTSRRGGPGRITRRGTGA